MLLVFRFPLVLTRNMLLSVFLWTWCIFVLPLAAFRIPFYHQFKAIFWLHGLVYCSSWFLVLRLCWTSWVFVFTVFIKFGKVSTIISFRYCPAISLWLQLHIYLGYLRLFHTSVQFSSFRFSRSVVSDSLRPHESQHARPPCPSSTQGVYPNSCPSSQWCHPSSHLILCRPLLLPPIPPSIRVFSNESALCIRWSKYFQLQHQSFQWIFRTDFL